MADDDRQSLFSDDQIFVAFDTETTGIWAPAHKLVEVGGVKFDAGGTTLDRFQELINPERPIPADVIGVHGITDRMVARADAAGDVLSRFQRFCGEDSILIAHNAPFDISFISCELERLGRQFSANPVLDTVDIYRTMHKNLESYSLLSLSRTFSLAESQEHRALADAELVRQLFSLALDGFSSMESWTDFQKQYNVYRMDEWKSKVDNVPERFEPLVRVIENSGKVRITYASPNVPLSERVVRPHQLFAHRSNLYMAAFCFTANAERTFRLDRISDFKVLDEA